MSNSTLKAKDLTDQYKELAAIRRNAKETKLAEMGRRKEVNQTKGEKEW